MLTKIKYLQLDVSFCENYVPFNKGFNMDTALQFSPAFVAFLLPVPLFQP